MNIRLEHTHNISSGHPQDILLQKLDHWSEASTLICSYLLRWLASCLVCNQRSCNRQCIAERMDKLSLGFTMNCCFLFELQNFTSFVFIKFNGVVSTTCEKWDQSKNNAIQKLHIMIHSPMNVHRYMTDCLEFLAWVWEAAIEDTLWLSLQMLFTAVIV